MNSLISLSFMWKKILIPLSNQETTTIIKVYSLIQERHRHCVLNYVFPGYLGKKLIVLKLCLMLSWIGHLILTGQVLLYWFYLLFYPVKLLSSKRGKRFKRAYNIVLKLWVSCPDSQETHSLKDNVLASLETDFYYYHLTKAESRLKVGGTVFLELFWYSMK